MSRIPLPPPLGYERLPTAMSARGWVMCHVNTFGVIDWFPNYCCNCLAETGNRWEIPHMYSRSRIRIKIPICPDCHRKWTAKRNRMMLWASCVGIGCAIATYLFPYHDRELQIVLFGMTLGFGLSFGPLFVGQFIGLPVQLGIWWRGRKKVRIRFRNRAFWPLLSSCWQANATGDDTRGAQ